MRLPHRARSRIEHGRSSRRCARAARRAALAPDPGTPEQIQARWDEPALRDAILKDIPVADASLTIGGPDRDWGVTVTLELRLSAAVPDMGTQALTGKALRRLKALCETGEIPSTAFNPAARDDAGEPPS